ncbi:MAG: hypothetical protein ACK5N0_01345, partial [Synechococcaceae cyanobacterium]
MPDRPSRRVAAAQRNRQTRTPRGPSSPRLALASPALWRRAALVVAGAVVGLGLLGLVWPEQD